MHPPRLLECSNAGKRFRMQKMPDLEAIRIQFALSCFHRRGFIFARNKLHNFLYVRLGEPLRWGRHAYKRQVGFMLEDLALMERLTGREQLELAARLYGLSPEQATATIEALVAPFEVATALDRWIETYSHGMRRQLAFLLALLHRPRLLVLDEPFEAMDAQAIEAAIALLQARHREGATLLISSHRLDKLERLCDHLVVLHRGRVRFAGPMAAFRDHLPEAATLETAYLRWLRESD
ncbi:ABC transporter ATP-binding protein [Rhodothermus marinus]|uniref:ABC transporter ATP-binding protein n=1 Tax=Rhodothermus marinus TaxID=29549 RepID=UPI0034E937C2